MASELGVPARLFLQLRLEDRLVEDFLFLVGGIVEERRILLGAGAQMDQQGGVAAVVEDHVRLAAVMPLEDLVGVVPVFLEALALHGEDRRAGLGDGGGGVVLRRVDVARGPAHVRAQRLQRLDQHARLDGHVQRTGDARALERLLRAVFLADRHQARHFGLGHVEFLAAPVGESDVLDDVVGHVALLEVCPFRQATNCESGRVLSAAGSGLNAPDQHISNNLCRYARAFMQASPSLNPRRTFLRRATKWRPSPPRPGGPSRPPRRCCRSRRRASSGP